MPDEIGFRRLRREDFGLLRAWLEEPRVRRWWNHESDAAALERDFGPAIDGADPAETFVALEDGRPFGLIQRYRLDDNPEYVRELEPYCEIRPGALSIDYLIGEPESRGRGLGAAMIAACVHAGWTAHPDCDQVVVPVHAGNEGSWRALERAGFVRVGTGELEPDNPVDSREHVIYAITRPRTARA